MTGLLAISSASKLLEFNTIKSEYVLAKKVLDIKKAQETNLLTKLCRYAASHGKINLFNSLFIYAT